MNGPIVEWYEMLLVWAGFCIYIVLSMLWMINKNNWHQIALADVLLSNSKKESFMSKIVDKFRMLIWLVIGLALYWASHAIGTDFPTWQTIAYKLGHVTTLAWVGYWIARMSVGRIDGRSSSNDRVARALVIAGVIIAGSLGL